MRTDEEVTTDMRRARAEAVQRMRLDGPNAVDADFVHVMDKALSQRGWRPHRAVSIQPRKRR